MRNKITLQYRHFEIDNPRHINYGKYSEWKTVTESEYEDVGKFIEIGFNYETRIIITQLMKTLEITLKNAVIDTVAFFSKYKMDFSIFEVTAMVRTEINYGKYTIEGVRLANNKDMIQFISHQDVRDQFADLFDSDELGACKLKHTGGQYNIYGVEAIADDVDDVVNDILKVASTSTPVPTSVQTSPTLSYNLVETYVKNRGEATLKQIQSRFKAKGVTCRDLFRILTSDNAFSIDESSKCVSKFVVTV